MTEPLALLVPWDKSPASLGQSALAAIEQAIDALAEALAAEEADRLPLEGRMPTWERAETLLKEAVHHAVDGRAALRRREALEAKERGFEQCRGCYGWRDPRTMHGEPFFYGTHGEQGTRFICPECRAVGA